MSEEVLLDGASLTLEGAVSISRGAAVVFNDDAPERLSSARDMVLSVAEGSASVYGVNTGYGYLAGTRVSGSELRTLQLNIIKSHAAGAGDPLSIPETRLMMALRLNVLLAGHTGVRLRVCEALRDMINAGVYPIIPEYGSVGASGDLAPLAHLALPLVGLGKVSYRGKVQPSRDALKAAGLKAVRLVEKEGLGLINGTQGMLAVGLLSLMHGLELLEDAERICALTFEGLAAHVEPLDRRLHELRGQEGQIESARRLREELEDSSLWEDGIPRDRVQDPYSLRCAPQIHGASRDMLANSRLLVSRELNAVTDNPLVFPEDDAVLSGGNFHGQYLAMAFDSAAMALAELGNVSERRLEVLMNPHLSGLPAFLSPNPGLESGYMAAQYLSASLVNENKLLANPSCTDSIPGNVGIEDHVSMGMTSARKLRQLVNNLRTILAVEWLAAAQAVDFRDEAELGNGTWDTYQSLRSMVPTLVKDRVISEEIQLVADLL